jgi:hypothetical protein
MNLLSIGKNLSDKVYHPYAMRGRASNLLGKHMHCYTQELIAKNLECGGRMTYQVK